VRLGGFYSAASTSPRSAAELRRQPCGRRSLGAFAWGERKT